MFGHHEEEDFDLKSRHHCTDIPCCVLFVVSLGVFGLVYRSAAVSGDVGKLYHGIDWAGKVCGVDAGVEDRPYLYWCASASATGGGIHLNTGKPVCVATCPDGSLLSPIFNMNAECALVSGSLSQMVPYKTVTLLDRYCIPDTSSDKGASQQIAYKLNNFGMEASEALSSLPASWPVLVGAFTVAVVLGYLYLVMLRHCAESLIWLSIGLSVLGCGAFGIYLWVNAGTLLQSMPVDSSLKSDLESIQGHEETATKIAAAACFGFAALLVCVAHCLQHQIHVASLCVESACEAIFDMPSLLLAPICKVFIKGFAFLVLIYGFLNLWTTSEMTTGDDGMLRHFAPTDEQKGWLLFYVTMSFWILAFLSAVYQFTVAYAVTEYYYCPYDDHGEKDVGCCEVCEGLQVGLMYHAGSLAFGSLLIALLTVLQKLIEYAEHQNRESVNNRAVACILCCLQCLVSCCKDLVSRVNRVAYIDMAITSDNFCDCAQRALGVIAGMAASLGILTGATFVFSVFGVMVICLGCSYFAYHMASHGEFADHTSQYFVDSPMSVTAASLGISALVAFAFMDIVDVASDTLLYCYATDRTSAGGGQTAPKHLKDLFS